MVFGSRVGKKIVNKLKKEVFIYIVEALLLITGLQMLLANYF